MMTIQVAIVSDKAKAAADAAREQQQARDPDCAPKQRKPDGNGLPIADETVGHEAYDRSTTDTACNEVGVLALRLGAVRRADPYSAAIHHHLYGMLHATDDLREEIQLDKFTATSPLPLCRHDKRIPCPHRSVHHPARKPRRFPDG